MLADRSLNLRQVGDLVKVDAMIDKVTAEALSTGVEALSRRTPGDNRKTLERHVEQLTLLPDPSHHQTPADPHAHAAAMKEGVRRSAVHRDIETLVASPEGPHVDSWSAQWADAMAASCTLPWSHHVRPSDKVRCAQHRLSHPSSMAVHLSSRRIGPP